MSIQCRLQLAAAAAAVERALSKPGSAKTMAEVLGSWVMQPERQPVSMREWVSALVQLRVQVPELVQVP